MRKKPLKPGVVALILALIYIAGMAVGMWIISYLPSKAKRPGMVYMAHRMTTEYAESGTVDPSSLGGVMAMVYTKEGQLTDTFRGGGRPIYYDFQERAEKLLPRILSGEELIHLVPMAKDDTTLGYTSLVYIGVPMVENDLTSGAMIWVRELQDLLESILAFIGTFTAVFILVAFLMLLNLRNQRRYEQMRRQYIDNITHELKTPVASIKALAEALSDGMDKSPTDRNVYYGMIIREANRQERMICDVLELSRLQNFRVDMKKETIPAAEVIQPVCDKYASLCDLMGIEFHVDPEVTSLPPLYTDKQYLQTVLDALLSNALKFVSEDGNIHISARVSRKRVTFCVADDGAGIAPEELPHVFERFYKGVRSDNEVGSGLGLAIAKESMDSMREKLWIRSQAGVGTQAYFTVSLT